MKRPRVRQLDLCAAGECGPDTLVFDALDQLAPGEQLCMRVEQEPFALYRHLSNQAFAYCTRVLADAVVEVTIWRCGLA